MEQTIIEYVDKLPTDIESAMRKDLVAYEHSQGIDVNYKQFALMIKNDTGNVIGVLNAYTAFSEIYIDDLWVNSKHRKQGYGTQLITALEERFKGKGFNNINLVTSAFQAPEFYKKCGFKVEFVRTNKHNPKLTKTFLIKYFDDNVQTQGIWKNSEM